jgi:AcrR family transcriptional regulator
LLAGENLPPNPRQARSTDKRNRLKSAALSLFSEKGYERTSIEEVAQRASLAVGGFYLHFRSKRQLLLVLMDDLLEGLNNISLQPGDMQDIRSGIRNLLSHAFSHDLRYLGAYRAWREAVLSDAALAQKEEEIRAWTTARVKAFLRFLAQCPGARSGVDVTGLAIAMDRFFWDLLSQAKRLSKAQLNRRLNAATHLIYHAMFED